ncbi:hypothetical protein Ahy_B07g086364 [Arachis hypogaea]|uniref:DYW domain-containing protein n=1 Tax=Arachis hypogaea TaxID=3818 RepID=A0A444Y9K3_ARAHY|nr:hypothetical protein Ahy_B07g086364 [Arachis hypogaea]
MSVCSSSMSLYSINDVMLKGHAHQILMSSSICGVRPQETGTSNSYSFNLSPEKSQINHVAAQSISATILSSSTIMGKHNHYVISLACQSMNMRLLVPKPKVLLPKVKSTMGSMTWPSGFLLGLLVCNSNSKPTNSDESEDDGNERDEFNESTIKFSHVKKVYTDYYVIELDGEKCMNLNTYITRLLAFAIYASLVPKIEHYGCMVDLLGRVGLLEEAQELIKDMPMRPNSALLGSFLAACKVHKNVNLAEWAAKQFLSLESKKCGYNVLMSNIYAASNRRENVASIKRAMKDVGIHKEPGFSFIEVHGTIHEFVTGDREHPETPKIYEMIVEMRENLEHAGYTPNVSVVLKNIDMEEKESAVNYHSEKLAMAYGLISTGPGIQLRTLKDLLTSTAESKIFHITDMHDKIITINRKSLEIEYLSETGGDYPITGRLSPPLHRIEASSVCEQHELPLERRRWLRKQAL